MDNRITQLERLLDMADMRLMRLVELAIFGFEGKLALSANLQDRRKELLSILNTNNLTEKALQYLVVEKDEEFIPRRRWQLNELIGVGDNVLNHKHFHDGQRFVAQRFSPGRKKICLFLPCHKVKPYSLSPTIQVVTSALESRNLSAHVVMAVASVPGIVPLGFDRHYPFAYYNWDPLKETKAIIRSYTKQLQVRAREFIKLTKASFTVYVAYFRPQSVELEALRRAAGDEGVSIRIVPHKHTVRKIKERNRAVWRYAGLKRFECISDLINLLDTELRRRSPHVSATDYRSSDS